MPRYFFSIFDGHVDIDDIGTDLPDLDAARLHALRTATRVIVGEAEPRSPTHDWRMEIEGEGHELLLILSFTAASVPWVLRESDLGTDVDGPPEDPWSR